MKVIIMGKKTTQVSFSKFSPKEIICNHIHTMKDIKDNWSLIDILLFFIAAPLISGVLLYLSLYQNNFDYSIQIISEGALNSILTSLSIFVALLLNLLILLYSVSDKVKENKNVDFYDKKIKYLTHMHDNITFGIFIALIGIIFLSVYILNLLSFNIYINELSFYLHTDLYIVYLIYLTIVLFILTMFMVIKSVHIVFRTTLGNNK